MILDIYLTFIPEFPCFFNSVLDFLLAFEIKDNIESGNIFGLIVMKPANEEYLLFGKELYHLTRSHLRIFSIIIDPIGTTIAPQICWVPHLIDKLS